MTVALSDNLKKDQWLSTIIEKETFILSADSIWINKVQDDLEFRNEFKKFLKSDIFVSTKIGTKEVGALKVLTDLGFLLIDTTVTFSKPIDGKLDLKSSSDISLAKDKDQEGIVKVVGDNFVYSRFYLDPKIPLVLAKKIKTEWVKNYFRGFRGDQMLVAKVDGQTVGFNQLLFTEDNSLHIDLIAVDRKFSRRGIASGLIAYGQNINQDKRQYTAGTQVANIPSIRVFEKFGFKIFRSQYVLHHLGGKL